MNRRDPEWVEYAAREYIRRQAAYQATTRALLDRMAGIRERMEGVLPGLSDAEGRAQWQDKMPEALDTLEAIRERLIQEYELRETEFNHALDVFQADQDAWMVWQKYGEGRTWAAVARVAGYSESRAKHRAPQGFRYIFDHMPMEYRRVPVNAEDREMTSK